MNNNEMIWNKFLSLIKKRFSSLGYDTWFKDTYLYSLGDEAVIVVPTIAHKKHLAESYKDLIEEVLNSVTGTNFPLKFVLENEIETTQSEQEQISNNFGRGGSSNKPEMKFNSREQVETIDSIEAVVDFTVIMQLLGIGILLTLMSSLASMISIQRFSPLTILKERS